MEPKTGLEPATTRVSGDNPILRPVEIGAPDGNRTHVSRNESGCSLAVELRGCPRNGATLSRASWMRFCAGHRVSGGIRNFSMDKKCRGLETGGRPRTCVSRTCSACARPPGDLSRLSYSAIGFVCLGDNPQRAAHRNWGGQTDLHRCQRRHRAQCCCYTMTTVKMTCRRSRQAELGPLVGLAPTNTGLRNPPCSC